MAWRAIGASAIGSSHVASMTRCQDSSAFATVTLGDGESALVATVADGAGTALAAHHGAQTAVAATLDYLVRAIERDGWIDTDGMHDAFRFARERVLETANEYGHAPRDYASTLLALAAFPDRTLAAQIGDGAIVIDDGVLRPLTWPQQGEYANSTHFLVEDDALERVIALETGTALRAALFSDGLQNLALHYESRTAFMPFFAPFFGYLENSPARDDEIQAELERYLESPALCARTDDDKSLVLAVRR